MKNNLEHYPRKKNWSKHPKIKMLKIKYGEAGDSKFGTLCDYIADAEWCWLDLSAPYIKTDVADALKFSFEELDGFVFFIENECNLIIRDGSKISTNTAQETLNLVMKERESAKGRRTKQRTFPEQLKTSSEQKLKSEESNTTKTTKESKVEKSKVEDSKIEDSKENVVSPKFLIGNDYSNNLKEFLEKNFQILMNDQKIKYGQLIFDEALKEFQENNLQKQWKDSQDLRQHFTNYLRIFSENKKNGKKNGTDNNFKGLKSTINIGSGDKMGKL